MSSPPRHDAASGPPLRELPWLSLGIAAVWLVGLVASGVVGSGARAAADRSLSDAVRVFVESPMLEIHPRLLPVLRERMPGYDGNRAFDFLRGSNRPERQAELDGHVSRAFAHLDAHPERRLGLVPAALRPHGWLTHPLVHTGPAHLAAALLPFLLAAPLLERLWGRGLLAATLAASALAAAAASSAWYLGQDRPLLGGLPLAVAACCALGFRLRGRDVELLSWLPGDAVPSLRVPSWTLLGALLAGEWLGLLGVSGGLPTSVDVQPGLVGHVAAAGTATLLAALFERRGLERHRVEPRPVRKPRASRYSLARIERARDEGDARGAFEMALSEVRHSPRSRPLVLLLLELGREVGELELAAAPLLRLAGDELRRGSPETAVELWKRLLAQAPRVHLDPWSLLRLAPHLRERVGPSAARRALLQILDRDDAELDAASLLETALVAGEGDPDLAREAAARAAGRRDLDPGQRSALRALEAKLGCPDEELPGLTPEEPSEAPPDPFFAEQDRSPFGGIDLLAELDGGPPAEESPAPEARVRRAVPLALEAEVIALEVEGRGRVELPYARIRGVAMAGVRGLAAKPVIVVDLLLREPGGAAPLPVLRLRSDEWSALALAPGAGGALAALRRFVAELRRRAGAPALPQSGDGPVPIFGDLAAYTRDVLRARPDPGSGSRAATASTSDAATERQS